MSIFDQSHFDKLLLQHAMILQRSRGQNPVKNDKINHFFGIGTVAVDYQFSTLCSITKDKYPVRYTNLPDKGDILVSEPI